MIVLVVENGWCLYEINLDAKTLYVMDPMMASSTQDNMERKHMKTSRLMLHCFCKCLHEWYPDWHFATYPWTYKYNSGIHKNCSRWVVFSEYDLPVTHFDDLLVLYV